MSNLADIMGVLVLKSEKSDLGKTPMLTAPSRPTLPFAKIAIHSWTGCQEASWSERMFDAGARSRNKSWECPFQCQDTSAS
eukprot:1338890-Pyramimonas_sp.AAC.1